MVDRQYVLRARGLRHAPSLFRTAVIVYPWVVRADRHDGEIHRIRNAAELLRVCRVSSKQHAIASHVDQVTVVAAERIGTNACTPVIDLKPTNSGGSDPLPFPPLQLGD